jgi:hypothetical protein
VARGRRRGPGWSAAGLAADPLQRRPRICPGRNLVLLATSNVLAALLDGEHLRLKHPARLRPDRPLPGTPDNYSLRFELAA